MGWLESILAISKITYACISAFNLALNLNLIWLGEQTIVN